MGTKWRRALGADLTHLADTVFLVYIHLLYFSTSFHRHPISSQHFLWAGFLTQSATSERQFALACLPEEFKPTWRKGRLQTPWCLSPIVQIGVFWAWLWDYVQEAREPFIKEKSSCLKNVPDLHFHSLLNVKKTKVAPEYLYIEKTILDPLF